MTSNIIFRQIWDHYVNMKEFFLPGNQTSLEEKYKQYFKDQEEWANNMVEQLENTDPFWRHLGYVNAQLQGLYDGYKTVAPSDWVGNVEKLSHRLCSDKQVPCYNRLLITFSF